MDGQKNETLEAKLKRIKAVDIMSRYAITTEEETTIADIAHLMMRFKISGVPVLGKDKKICGIITATDLFKLMGKIVGDIENHSEFKDYYKMPVKSFMTTDVMTITPETTLYEIMRIMWEKNIHTLPVVVVSKQEIAGVIGRRDVINACYGTAGSKAMGS